MRPLVCLTMILKNEAHCIRKTLDSVKGFVDCWAILDTGSTDGTQAVVAEVLCNIPGKLYEEPFIDFATSRNRALQLAQFLSGEYVPECLDSASIPVFTLMLSADETFSGGRELREFLEGQRDSDAGAFSIIMSAENARWFYPRVLRVNAGWKYVGEVHEVPLGPNRETHGPLIPGVVVTHAATDKERRFKRLRDFDLPRLTEMVADETRPLPDRAQAVWFLAQTYEALADGMKREPGGEWITYKLIAMSLYWRRVEIGGLMGDQDDTFKTNYAIFRYMNVAEKVGFYNDEELLNKLNGILAVESRIPEIHYMVAVHAAKLDVRQGLFFAEQAARVARETAESTVYHLPIDMRLEWLSLGVGAACARQLNRLSYARDLAERAVAAGGPAEMFGEYLTLQDVVEMSETIDVPMPTISASESSVLQLPDMT